MKALTSCSGFRAMALKVWFPRPTVAAPGNLFEIKIPGPTSHLRILEVGLKQSLQVILIHTNV